MQKNKHLISLDNIFPLRTHTVKMYVLKIIFFYTSRSPKKVGKLLVNKECFWHSRFHLKRSNIALNYNFTDISEKSMS
jgi:hypothetical protein